MHLEDERSDAEMKTLLDSHNCVLLLGAVPGVGKTAALKRYCHTQKPTSLFVGPTNKLRVGFVGDGYVAVTVDKLLGLRVGAEGEPE